MILTLEMAKPQMKAAKTENLIGSRVSRFWNMAPQIFSVFFWRFLRVERSRTIYLFLCQRSRKLKPILTICQINIQWRRVYQYVSQILFLLPTRCNLSKYMSVLLELKMLPRLGQINRPKNDSINWPLHVKIKGVQHKLQEPMKRISKHRRLGWPWSSFSL